MACAGAGRCCVGAAIIGAKLKEEHGNVLSPLEQPRFGAEVDDFSVNTRCVRRGDTIACEDWRLASVVNLPKGIRHLDTGAVLACASSEAELLCWGWTSWSKPEPAGSRHATDHPSGFMRPLQGVLIDKPSQLRIDSLTVGAHHGCFIGDDRAAYCFGETLYGEWGTGVVAYGEQGAPDLQHDFRAAHEVTALGHSVRELTAIGLTTCALRDDGSVWCWGGNEERLVANVQRQFPVYSVANRHDLGGAAEPLPVQRADLGTDNVHLIRGWRHVCVEKRDRSYWCWGDNRVAQLHSACEGLSSSECLARLNTEEGTEHWLPPRKLELPIPRCPAR